MNENANGDATASQAVEENAVLNEIDRTVTKLSVQKAAVEAIEKYGVEKNGGPLKVWEAFRLVLLSVEQEMLTSVGITDCEAFGYDAVLQVVWAFYPKNTSAWQQEYFGEKGPSKSLASRYRKVSQR